MVPDPSWYSHSVALPVSLQLKSAEVCVRLSIVTLSGLGHTLRTNSTLSMAMGGWLVTERSLRHTKVMWYTPVVGTLKTSLWVCQLVERLRRVSPSIEIQVEGIEVALRPVGRLVPAVRLSETGTRAARRKSKELSPLHFQS